MKTMRDIMEAVVLDLNQNYYTIGELSKEWGYSNNTFIARKVKELKLGYKLKGTRLLSEKDVEILMKSIKKRKIE